MGDSCFENMHFRFVVVEGGVPLSAVDIVGYEFFENVGHGCVVKYLVDEGDNVDCIEGLREVYCSENCSVGRSFLVKAMYDGIYDRMECSVT